MDRKKFIRNGILGIASLATAAKLLESCSKDDSNTRDNVFSDSLANETATLTCNLTDGYTLSKTITVNG
ncbi:hypothetical protein [Flavobacterium cupreum]|uniref:hypothetical protein n=1 Tax=Flavobacterium cupreum TaxID=2133766 RepID=UPI00187391DC|nr:hypothetical protein [Flavobacterium cupreum]